MKMLTAAAAFVVAAVTAGAVQAQEAGPPMIGKTYREIGRMTAAQQSWRFETEEQRRARLGSPEELEEEYGAERMDLARRVADLVEQGRCREARELASAAGERQMVIRIRQTCRGRG